MYDTYISLWTYNCLPIIPHYFIICIFNKSSSGTDSSQGKNKHMKLIYVKFPHPHLDEYKYLEGKYQIYIQKQLDTFLPSVALLSMKPFSLIKEKEVD